ncbi:glycosyltransferase family 2 protein [Brachybacterium sp. EF45031]|uniref:glycosyltransferase family 2 protein n=1 Tax=Brachybacterium sillae TaxID=2810536 RepID=UPI00217E41A1|nr:glycosyltransferase family 2 protein [Brachybacterium sillae]MCS6711622.1 glycosyltransferase family 2 protein [Brachybacterium sillae]
MTQPVASVIVPSYRGAERLPALLDSLAHQQAGTPAFEVIVVIDGVDDGSVKIVESETRFPIQCIQFPENRGRVAALNAGFEKASGDILIRCDDDLVPQQDYVARHVAAHSAHSCGVVGLYRNVFAQTRYSEVYGESAQKKFLEAAYRTPDDQVWRYWAGNCSISRHVWEVVGEYDPTYRLYGWEDVDYGYRIWREGFPVILDQSLETPHRVAAVTAAGRAQRAVYSGAARRIFERKFPDTPLPAAAPDWTLWNIAVRCASPVVARHPRAVGGFVDFVLRFAPPALGRKLVAVVVEGAAWGGYKTARHHREVF